VEEATKRGLGGCIGGALTTALDGFALRFCLACVLSCLFACTCVEVWRVACVRLLAVGTMSVGKKKNVALADRWGLGKAGHPKDHATAGHNYCSVLCVLYVVV
jgi:hypothetical protein